MPDLIDASVGELSPSTARRICENIGVAVAHPLRQSQQVGSHPDGQ
jgi:hypothetical protein